ncbi:MAG: type III secretion system chaperone [Bacteroidota bacterium]
MKRLSTLFALFFTLFTFAQMDNSQLEILLSQQADSVIGTPGRWQVVYQEMPMMVVTDETNDRMRIIAPIIEVDKLDEEVLLDCLAANFHSALDVKYAVSNDIMWCVFIHPLSPLSGRELKSAIEQVYYGAATFGTSYSSTPLLFGGGNGEQTPPKPKLKKT